MRSHSTLAAKDLSGASKSDEHVFFSALILLGLIFGFFVLANTGLLQLALTSDRSMISWVILALYSLATLHWLFRAKALDRENTLCRSVEESRSVAADLDGSYVALALNTSTATVADRQHLLDTLGDELTNTHAAGHFVADLLLKLGLTGTVIGFILMLLPIGEIDQFDPSLMQQLLCHGGGMAVALYTTLAGLVPVITETAVLLARLRAGQSGQPRVAVRRHPIHRRVSRP